MSKLQTALQKITSTRGEGGSTNHAATIRSALQAERARKGESGLEANQSVEVDFNALTDDGVAISAEYEGELRDEMRRVKWPLLANAFGEQAKSIPRSNVIMVASATSGEGKTFTAINLAMSIAAEKDLDVLLIDADIAKPHASELFGLTKFKGVIDYLGGEVDDIVDVIVGTNVSGLYLLPAGRPDEHASELIASGRMAQLVKKLSMEYPNTVILFDTSPILLTNESQVLSQLVGQVLMVVAANQTPQPAVKEAVSLLGSETIVNVVFNGMTSLLGQKHRYGGYYGYQTRR